MGSPSPAGLSQRGSTRWPSPPLGVHRSEGVTDNIVEEWTGVDGMEVGSEGVRLWVAEHHVL